MSRIFSSFLPCVILFFGAMEPCLGNSDSDLKAIRDIAASLLKQKGISTPEAFCALTTMRPTNSCSANNRLEDSLVAHRNGSLDRIRFRSFAEGPDPMPGQFRGRFSPEKWKALLLSLSKMDLIKPIRRMPMPGHSETYTQLTLSDGKRTSSYSISGSGPIGQDLISDAFDQMSILGQSATDTLWALSLNPLSAKLKNGRLEVQAEWKLAGKSAVSISMPTDPKDSICGSTTLAWFNDKPETPGVTPLPVEFQFAKASRSSGEDQWAAINAKTPRKMVATFSLPAEKKSGPKAGKVIQHGVLVKSSPTAETVRVTLFSESITF